MNFNRILIVMCPLLLCGCTDHNEPPVIPPPWWILNVYAVESTGESPPPAVNGCPHIRWRIFPTGDFHDASCTVDNRVKVWGHIDESMTIEFQVQCEGYQDSQYYVAFMDKDEIRHRIGREGPEVEQSRTVYLIRG